MVGARDMVFPYVNMVSYWVYLFAVLLLVASFFVTGGRRAQAGPFTRPRQSRMARRVRAGESS